MAKTIRGKVLAHELGHFLMNSPAADATDHYFNDTRYLMYNKVSGDAREIPFWQADWMLINARLIEIGLR